MSMHVYEWQDRDGDVTGSIEAWEPDMHPFIVGVLRLVTTKDAPSSLTSVGIYIDHGQAQEIARALTELADAHVRSTSKTAVDDLARERQMAAIESGRTRDDRRGSATHEGWGRWETSLRVEVAPHDHGGDNDPLATIWHEGGGERWPPDATPTEIAVATLREAADEIGRGAWPPIR